MDQRLALILMFSLIGGILTGVLTFAGGIVWPLAVIAGAGAFVTAARFADWLVK